MPYTDNIPQSGQTLGQTQANINTNFSIIRTVQKVNHEDFDNANEGKHKFLQMPEQGAGPTTAVNEAGFYSKPGTNPVETNLFFRAENSGFEYQLTKAVSASTASFGTSTGWTFLPGGLLLQWGVANIPSGTGGTVVFPVAYTNPAYSVQLTMDRSSTSSANYGLFLNGTPTNTGFATNSGLAGSHDVFWMAIGS